MGVKLFDAWQTCAESPVAGPDTFCKRDYADLDAVG